MTRFFLTSHCSRSCPQQIDRGHGTIARGRLAQLLTEGMSPLPRWLVKFDGQPYKDEEMYELSFGKLLYSAAVEVDDNGQDGTSGTEAYIDRNNNDGAVNNVETSSEGEKSDVAAGDKPSSKRAKSSKKSVQFGTKGSGDQHVNGRNGTHDASSPLEDDNDDASNKSGSSGRNSKASAREQRSHRRQAKIDEETLVIPGTGMLVDGKRALSSMTGPAAKKYKQNPELDSEVVKVKLLTGTLYLHRGAHRRVEFVRRV